MVGVMTDGEQLARLRACSLEIARLRSRDQVIERALTLSLSLTAADAAILDLLGEGDRGRREAVAAGVQLDRAILERLRGRLAGVIAEGSSERCQDEDPAGPHTFACP